ncbi:hypothetical protein [Paenibacillus naphthalenovorans]|uniref:Uncharacterized protein n=1 Tax=Paenibacillus naphthalenovorans TaxID=162209 RepID=A0A0U2W482_9BACL|nr:hypothetical protein [Paenibacillus naphthalenovorans]ALS22221.1 hypothetical protein IJ22_18470 [Paenibacillus naphthalenovorans]
MRIGYGMDEDEIVVHTRERFLHEVARIVKKKTLVNTVKKSCEAYQKGICSECIEDVEKGKDELSYGCLAAWKLTIGKGRKII